MHHFAQFVYNDDKSVLPLSYVGMLNMKSKLTKFQQSVGIGSGSNDTMLYYAA